MTTVTVHIGAVGTSAWTVEDVRAAERALMARLPDGALMLRAAAGLASRCAQLLRDSGGVYGARVVLLVGPGDNGGDALFAGARLAARGARVEAYRVRDPHAGGLAALRRAGGLLRDGVPVGRADLVVDGLLGIGGRGGLRPEYAALGASAGTLGGPVVAVDLPSGVDADTGAVTGDAVTADVTVAFGALKPGLLVGDGALRAGLVEVVDIGLSFAGPPAAVLVTLGAAAACWRRPHAGDDKYTRGVVGVATGSSAYPGAAVLSTGGALAGPAGYLRYAGDAADAVRAAHPEAVCTDTLDTAGRVQAWVAGSGLGTDEAAERTVRTVLDADVPVVLDADALTILARHPDWVAGRSAPTVLTPHDREFARLAGEVGDDRIGAARRAADRLGAVVLLKGHHTVVVGPGGGPARVVGSGVPELATAGTGDVLSGLLGSVLAAPADRGADPGADRGADRGAGRGVIDPVDATAAAAFAHGLAGRFAARRGPVSASGVLAALPDAVRVVLEAGVPAAVEPA